MYIYIYIFIGASPGYIVGYSRRQAYAGDHSLCSSLDPSMLGVVPCRSLDFPVSKHMPEDLVQNIRPFGKGGSPGR